MDSENTNTAFRKVNPALGRKRPRIAMTGAELAEFRQANKLQRSDLARKLGVSTTTIRAWELGYWTNGYGAFIDEKNAAKIQALKIRKNRALISELRKRVRLN